MQKIPPEELRQRLQDAVQGEFEVGRLLGQGGYASVFLAQDLMLKRDVAIKVLDPNLSISGDHSERFLTEARLVAQLEHPHIVPIYQVEQKHNLLYIVMRFIPGTTLGGLLAKEGKIPPAQAASIARQVADALDFAHHHKVIHRDIKPDNILLDSSGHAVVTDFGIARAAAAARLTQEGMVVGTPQYMSPEQASGEEIDGRSDVYALGVVMYEMLAGHPPFGGRTAAQILAKHLSQKPPSLEDTSKDTPEMLNRIVATALAKDPGDRYATARAMAEALGGTAAPGALDSGAQQRKRRAGRRRKIVGVVIGVLVLLVVAFGFGVFTLARAVFTGDSPAVSMMGANMPPVLAQLAREKLQIPATDSIRYFFVAHGRPNTDGMVITTSELIRADSNGIKRLKWGNLEFTLNTTRLTGNGGQIFVKDKVTGKVDTIYRGLSTRELSVIGEALNSLEKSERDSTKK